MTDSRPYAKWPVEGIRGIAPAAAAGALVDNGDGFFSIERGGAADALLVNNGDGFLSIETAGAPGASLLTVGSTTRILSY